MAFFGLELAFHSALPMKRKEDCLILFIHWSFVNHGFLCLPLSPAPPKPEEAKGGSELLPNGWNQNDDAYELHYVRDGKIYMLKAILVDREFIVSVVRVEDAQVSSLTLAADKWIGDNYQLFQEAFKDKVALHQAVQTELLSPFLRRVPSPSGAGRPEGAPQPPPAGGSFKTSIPSASTVPTGPFAVGGGDLDPFGGGTGGGMLMDPRHPPYAGGRQIVPPIPSGLPEGAVPPGARFDPFGPVNPDYMFPGRGGRLPGDPRPRGGVGFADPNPDHLRPPPDGSDDMFM